MCWSATLSQVSSLVLPIRYYNSCAFVLFVCSDECSEDPGFVILYASDHCV